MQIDTVLFKIFTMAAVYNVIESILALQLLFCVSSIVQKLSIYHFYAVDAPSALRLII